VREVAEAQASEMLEGMIRSIKLFLDGNAKRAAFEYEEPMRLDEGQFNEFLDSLKGLGFYHANGGENLVADFVGYKEWLNYEEYRHSDENVVIYLEYVEVQSSDAIIYLKSLSITRDTIKDEEE
jgi:hypothetical protein